MAQDESKGFAARGGGGGMRKEFRPMTEFPPARGPPSRRWRTGYAQRHSSKKIANNYDAVPSDKMRQLTAEQGRD